MMGHRVHTFPAAQFTVTVIKRLTLMAHARTDAKRLTLNRLEKYDHALAGTIFVGNRLDFANLQFFLSSWPELWRECRRLATFNECDEAEIQSQAGDGSHNAALTEYALRSFTQALKTRVKDRGCSISGALLSLEKPGARDLFFEVARFLLDFSLWLDGRCLGIGCGRSPLKLVA